MSENVICSDQRHLIDRPVPEGITGIYLFKYEAEQALTSSASCDLPSSYGLSWQTNATGEWEFEWERPGGYDCGCPSAFWIKAEHLQFLNYLTSLISPTGTAPQEAQADPKKGQGFGGYDASKARNRDLPVPDEAEGDGTGDEKLGSAPGPAGTPSRRHYTQREVAAAKRLGLADGKLTKLAGPIFWAGGDHYPNLVRQNAADYKLLAAAMEREWSKYANES